MLTKLGKEFAKLRVDRNEKQYEMAERLGITPNFLSAIENGAKPVPYRLIDHLSKIYGLSEAERKKLKDATEGELFKPRKRRRKVRRRKTFAVVTIEIAKQYDDGYTRVISLEKEFPNIDNDTMTRILDAIGG